MTIALLLKVVHVIAAIVAVGANVTYAFWLRRAGTADRERLVFTVETIHKLDNLIATPAYVVVLLTGLGMVISGAFSFETRWIQVAIGLYVLVVVLSIVGHAPALRRQLAEAKLDPTSVAYQAAASRGNALGNVILVLVLLIVVLMVTKPAF